MIKLFFNLAESAAVVRAIINQVVTAVLLKCQTTDHIRMTEQFIVCLILNPDFKTILEIITTSTIRFAIDIMLQIKILSLLWEGSQDSSLQSLDFSCVTKRSSTASAIFEV